MGIFDRNRPTQSSAGTPTGPAKTVNLRKDPSGGAAVNLSKIRESGPAGVSLAKTADKAGVSLSKRGLGGMRAAVRLYIDHSGSMEFDNARDYTNGNVQVIVKRSLGFALQLDSDGVIPVRAFDSVLWPVVNVTADNYEDIVNQKIWKPSKMGGTKLSLVFEDLLEAAKTTDEPIVAIIVGDGNPNYDDVAKCTRLVCELAAYPVFIKFLAIRPVPYLQELDDLPDTMRLLDNFDTKPEMDSSLNLRSCTDLEFADAAADEWDSWIAAATAAGVLR